MDGINRVTAVFDDVKNNLQEEYCIYHKNPVTNMDDDDDDDAVEEVTVGKEKNKPRIGHRQTFPQKILNFGLYKRQHDLSIRRQADRTNVMSHYLLC